MKDLVEVPKTPRIFFDTACSKHTEDLITPAVA